MSSPGILREVPLDRLQLPSDDVRQERSDEAVLDIASSMGDPSIGQQSAISCYPVDHKERDDVEEPDDLQAVYERGVDLVIHDGVTRYLASKQLGWGTLRAEILPEPPEAEVMARLSANTDRSDMHDYEVFRALREHYQSTEATLEDIGEKIGVSSSFVSQVFSLFDTLDCIRSAWATEEHPLGTSHAIACRGMLSEQSIEKYAQAGELTEQEARELCRRDAERMVEVQAERDLAVSEFRERITRLQKQTCEQLRDQRDGADKRADGQAARASGAETPQAGKPVEDCTVCGSSRQRERRKAVQVCDSCHGLLSEHEQHGDTLLQTDDLPGLEAAEPEHAVNAPSPTHEEAMQFLAELTTDEVAKVLQSLQQAGERSPEAR
jgi:hypothetical protein